jgi:long-chain acyl-CoA synthetase
LSTLTVSGDLRRSAERAPDAAAIVAAGRSVSYGELDALADRVATGLRERGVGRGDRVTILLPNGVPAVAAIQGTLRAGGAISPLNPSIKRDRLAQIVDRTEPAAIVCDEAHADTVGEAEERVARAPAVAHVDDLLASEGDGTAVRSLDDDLAAIMHTSGSTGEAKGVMLTHRNLTFATDSIVEYLEMSAADRVLCVLQLSFGYGLSNLLACIRVGATLVVEAGFAFPGRIVQLLEEQKITGLPGVPTVFQVLLSLSGLAEREFPDLRFITNAGAAIPTTAIAELRRAFPNASFYSMYGQTECIRVCYLPPDQLEERPSSVGIPIPGTEAWVENEDGEVAAPGEVGELVVRGPHVTQGYWRDSDGSEARLREGRWPWERVLATNDLFRRDEDGYLYFVGRRDDIIKSRGEKVAPREIEEVLHLDSGVREAAVVGVPDRLLGEAVYAHVTAKQGHSLDPAALRRLCAERLEDHMIPKRVVVHDELPRTPNGKLDRRALQDT